MPSDPAGSSMIHVLNMNFLPLMDGKTKKYFQKRIKILYGGCVMSDGMEIPIMVKAKTSGWDGWLICLSLSLGWMTGNTAVTSQRRMPLLIREHCFSFDISIVRTGWTCRDAPLRELDAVMRTEGFCGMNTGRAYTSKSRYNDRKYGQGAICSCPVCQKPIYLFVWFRERSDQCNWLVSAAGG